jgi:hypothetical protein
MTQYDTKAFNVGDLTVTLSKAKSGDAADRLQKFLEFLGEKITDPGYGKPEGGAGRPDNTLPGGSGGRPGQGLPGAPDNTLPGGSGGRPGQELPDSQPGVDNELPSGRPDRPSQGLPGEQPGIDNSLPQLGAALKGKAKEIAAEVLKGTLCDPASPKK